MPPTWIKYIFSCRIISFGMIQFMITNAYLDAVQDFLIRLGIKPFIRRTCGHVDVGTCPHQVLASTLTLSQPGGGADYAHPILMSNQVLKATGAPVYASIGNRHFFFISCHHQTQQNYQQSNKNWAHF
jgi:hypothetical protein